MKQNWHFFWLLCIVVFIHPQIVTTPMDRLLAYACMQWEPPSLNNNHALQGKRLSVACLFSMTDTLCQFSHTQINGGDSQRRCLMRSPASSHYVHRFATLSDFTSLSTGDWEQSNYFHQRQIFRLLHGRLVVFAIGVPPGVLIHP